MTAFFSSFCFTLLTNSSRLDHVYYRQHHMCGEALQTRSASHTKEDINITLHTIRKILLPLSEINPTILTHIIGPGHCRLRLPIFCASKVPQGNLLSFCQNKRDTSQETFGEQKKLTLWKNSGRHYLINASCVVVH